MIWTFKVQKAPKPFYQIQMWEEGGAVVREILRSLHKLLQKTDTEPFLCEDTVPAGNNWGQTVELNESLLLVSSHDQQRALDQAVKKQEHEHMSMMHFSLENTTYMQLYQLQILKVRFKKKKTPTGTELFALPL